MVPHRRILQAITLVAMARQDSAEYTKVLCKRLGVVFPCEVKDFAEKEVLPHIPAATRAWFLTSDCLTQKSYQPLYLACSALGLPSVILGIESGGPTVLLPKEMARWNGHDTIRKFIECTALAGIKATDSAADLSRMYGRDFDVTDLEIYGSLFADPEYATPEFWADYVKCVGDQEARFKHSMLGQPLDFVRWRLGVPVHVESDLIFDRMISDAYYTERLIKAENGRDLASADLARIKMERDTIFKAMDRRQKYREASGGEGSKEALTAIKQIAAYYESYDSGPTQADLR